MGLKYLGREPGSDFSVMTKKKVDDAYAAVSASDSFLHSATALAAATADLATPTYVDTQDGFRATKSAVDSADANYLLATTRGAANGVAPLGSDGYIPSANLPTLNSNRKPIFKNVDTVFLTAPRVVTTTNAKEYEAARLTIADPGFPYIPVPFAVIRGGAVNATEPASQSVGTGNYGQISILDASNVKWGWCITTGQHPQSWHTALPFADNTINPTARPPVTGITTLSLYLGVWTGTTYTFDNVGLQFYCLVYPGV